MGQKFVDQSLSISKSAFTLLRAPRESRPDRNSTLTADLSEILNTILSSWVVRYHTYDAGIIPSTERHDPRGGPSPTHWTFEGLYRTIDMASLPFSPRKVRPSQLRLIKNSCMQKLKVHSLLSNLSTFRLTYVFSNPSFMQVALYTKIKNQRGSLSKLVVR